MPKYEVTSVDRRLLVFTETVGKKERVILDVTETMLLRAVGMVQDITEIMNTGAVEIGGDVHTLRVSLRKGYKVEIFIHNGMGLVPIIEQVHEAMGLRR